MQSFRSAMGFVLLSKSENTTCKTTSSLHLYQSPALYIERLTKRVQSIFARKNERKMILAANDILRYYLSPNPSTFKFILLAEQGSDPNDYGVVIRTGFGGRLLPWC